MPVNNQAAGQELFKQRCLDKITTLKKELINQEALDTAMQDRLNLLEGRVRRYSNASDYQIITEQIESLQKRVDAMKKSAAKPIAMKEIPSYLREEKVVPKKNCCSCLFASKKPMGAKIAKPIAGAEIAIQDESNVSLKR